MVNNNSIIMPQRHADIRECMRVRQTPVTPQYWELCNGSFTYRYAQFFIDFTGANEIDSAIKFTSFMVIHNCHGEYTE